MFLALLINILLKYLISEKEDINNKYENDIYEFLYAYI